MESAHMAGGVGEEARAGGHLEEAVLARDVLLVLGVELAQVLDAVHELRHARGDVVVAVEANGAVCYGLGAVASLIQRV